MARQKAAPEPDATLELLKFLNERIAASTRRKRVGQITYVIGNNGTGKSKILGELAEQLKDKRPARTVACISNSIYDRFKYTDSARIRYLGARNAPNAVFHSAIDRQLTRLILQAMLVERHRFASLSEAINTRLTFTFQKDVEKQVKERLELHSRQGKISRKKARTHSDLLEPRAFAMLKRIVAGEGRFDRLTNAQISILLRYLELNIDIELNVHLDDGSVIGFKDLSTGEQNRTLLFAKILSAMEEGIVFLIDEPEISLHLHWQMQFHSTLMKLLAGLTRFHVVVATHAPILISEAAKFDPESHGNVVAVLRRALHGSEILGHHRPGNSSVTCDIHTFAEVASHEQLVLQYFQTAPYHGREVSIQIADAVLRVAEDAERNRTEAENLLLEIRSALGLSDDAKAKIDSAIALIQKNLVPSIQRELIASGKGAHLT